MMGELLHSSSSILSTTWTQGNTIILNLKGTVSIITSDPLCKDGNDRFGGSDHTYKKLGHNFKIPKYLGREFCTS